MRFNNPLEPTVVAVTSTTTRLVADKEGHTFTAAMQLAVYDLDPPLPNDGALVIFVSTDNVLGLGGLATDILVSVGEFGGFNATARRVSEAGFADSAFLPIVLPVEGSTGGFGVAVQVLAATAFPTVVTVTAVAIPDQTYQAPQPVALRPDTRIASASGTGGLTVTLVPQFDGLSPTTMAHGLWLYSVNSNRSTTAGVSDLYVVKNGTTGALIVPGEIGTPTGELGPIWVDLTAGPMVVQVVAGGAVLWNLTAAVELSYTAP